MQVCLTDPVLYPLLEVHDIIVLFLLTVFQTFYGKYSIHLLYSVLRGRLRPFYCFCGWTFCRSCLSAFSLARSDAALCLPLSNFHLSCPFLVMSSLVWVFSSYNFFVRLHRDLANSVSDLACSRRRCWSICVGAWFFSRRRLCRRHVCHRLHYTMCPSPT